MSSEFPPENMLRICRCIKLAIVHDVAEGMSLHAEAAVCGEQN